jgi:hypothetical protein
MTGANHVLVNLDLESKWVNLKDLVSTSNEILLAKNRKIKSTYSHPFYS